MPFLNEHDSYERSDSSSSLDAAIEQKANCVLAYLSPESANEQKEIVDSPYDEVPQLTAALKTQLAFQCLYFDIDIAIEEKDIAAVRASIDNGADINKALLLLFSQEHKGDTLYWLHDNPHLLKTLSVEGLNIVVSQGKYQGRTIAEILESTKKGRQLLWENPSLQDLFSQSGRARLLDDSLKKALTERKTKATEAGFFKKPPRLLVQAVAYGNLKKSKELLHAHSRLLKPLITEKATVYDYSGRKIKQRTAFQAALCAMDYELCAMLTGYMTPEEIQNQYQEIFPTGHQRYYANQEPFDFSQIINAIHRSDDKDIKKALRLESSDITEIWHNLEQFRTNFTQKSCHEAVFNPQHLIKAIALYDSNYLQWNSNQRHLFWRQVVGYVQRFLPANIAMDVAQGLYYRLGKKEPALRSFNFRDDGGAIFPLSSSLYCGLGFEYAAASWFGRLERKPVIELCGADAVAELVSIKKNNLGAIMQRDTPISCLGCAIQ